MGCGEQSKYQIKSILVAKSSQEITLAHYMVSMITLQTGTKSRQRDLMLSLPWFPTVMMSFGIPQALSWPAMTERIRNSQPRLKIGIDLLLQQVSSKTMGQGETHPMIFKDLADVIVKLPSMDFSRV